MGNDMKGWIREYLVILLIFSVGIVFLITSAKAAFDDTEGCNKVCRPHVGMLMHSGGCHCLDDYSRWVPASSIPTPVEEVMRQRELEEKRED